MIRLPATALILSLLLLNAGCSSKRTFTVYSWPPGARIFVDHDEYDQTVGRVTIDFSEQPYRTIWVKKEGMQPAGILVAKNSPEVVSFVLAHASSAENLKEIAEKLRAIEKRMTQ
jgi:hypothetical protein